MTTIQDRFRVGMNRILPELQEGPAGVILNLGCGNAQGNKAIHNAFGLQLPEWNAEFDPIPFGDETVGTIHAYHFLEHLRDPISLLKECQRVLKVGGVMNIVVPYYNSSLQAQDPDHKSAWCETSWQTTFSNTTYRRPNEPEQWRFSVGLNIIIGVVERNLCLMTQLIKRGDH